MNLNNGYYLPIVLNRNFRRLVDFTSLDFTSLSKTVEG